MPLTTRTAITASAAKLNDERERKRKRNSGMEERRETRATNRHQPPMSDVDMSLKRTKVNPASLSVIPQFSQLELENAPEKMKLLISADPGEKRSTSMELVLVLDQSISMKGDTYGGCPIETLVESYKEIINNGIDGIDELYLRVIGFGSHVKDYALTDYDTALVKLDAESKDAFLAIAPKINAYMTQTNISEAIDKGVEILQQYSVEKKTAVVDSFNLSTAHTQHVLVFTDGMPNNGITDGLAMRTHAENFSFSANNNILVHYIGLGRSIDETFITSATNTGKSGVFAYAKTSGQIGAAFETMFGKLVDIRGSMDVTVSVKATPSMPEVCTHHRLNLLCNAEDELIDVAVPFGTEAETIHDAITVTYHVKPGKEITVGIPLTFADTRGEENEEVKKEIADVIAAEEAYKKLLKAQNEKEAREIMDDDVIYCGLSHKRASKMSSCFKAVRHATDNAPTIDDEPEMLNLRVVAAMSQNA